jgi:transcriptional regulator with XRE-family HTH domain
LLDLFAKNLRETRLDLDLTQLELSKLCRTGVASIKRWEKGTTSPSLINVYGLAAALNCPVRRLVEGPDE